MISQILFNVVPPQFLIPFCCNNDIFVISYNTHSILNAYRAHHSVYSSYRAFNGHQAYPAVRQCKPRRSMVTEQMGSSAVFTKFVVFTELSVGSLCLPSEQGKRRM